MTHKTVQVIIDVTRIMQFHQLNNICNFYVRAYALICHSLTFTNTLIHMCGYRARVRSGHISLPYTDDEKIGKSDVNTEYVYGQGKLTDIRR